MDWVLLVIACAAFGLVVLVGTILKAKNDPHKKGPFFVAGIGAGLFLLGGFIMGIETTRGYPKNTLPLGTYSVIFSSETAKDGEPYRDLLLEREGSRKYYSLPKSILPNNIMAGRKITVKEKPASMEIELH